MHSDAIRHISVPGDAFGHFQKSSDLYLEIHVCLDNLGLGGVLFQWFYMQGVYFFRGVLLGARVQKGDQVDHPDHPSLLFRQIYYS